MFVVKKLLENLAFKLILVVEEHGVQFQEPLWKELNALDFVEVELVVYGGSLAMDLGVSANEVGLGQNLISDILDQLGVVCDLHVVVSLLLVHGGADVLKLLLVFDEQYWPVAGLEVPDVLIFPASLLLGDFLLGHLWRPLPLALGGFGLEAIGID